MPSEWMGGGDELVPTLVLVRVGRKIERKGKARWGSERKAGAQEYRQ